MLKTSKLSHKSSKDTGIRKSHLSRKTMPSRSPDRLPRNSRPPQMKRISPGMKRGHPIAKRKVSPSRLRSIASSPHRSISHRGKPESPVSIDRAHMKDLKYDKRKHLSRSPVRHMVPIPPRRPVLQHEVHDVPPPYHTERYQNSSIVQPPQYSPTRKKIRREADHYFASRSISPSPPGRHMPDPRHSESHVPLRVDNAPAVLHHKHRRNIPLRHDEREKYNYDLQNKRESPPIMPRGHSKDSTLKIPYPHESSRYRSASPDNRYLAGTTKPYGPTLHERFSSVIESNRTEPRIRYSREDLEKITIDIKGNARDHSPHPACHIMHPSDIKSARRANEGHRPIFDREEIKQAPRDLRYDAYYDRKTGSFNSTNLRDVENYQITARHQYESHTLPSNSGRALNDRWPNHEGKKDAMSLDRDEREKAYGKIPFSRNYVDARSHSRSADRDFRSERYLDAKPSTSRSDYPSRPPPPLPPTESRNNIPYPHRKTTVPVDARHKLNIRKGDRESHATSIRPEVKDHYLPPDRHFIETIPPSSRVERREYHSPIPESHKWDYKSRSPSRDKFSDFSRRPEKFAYRSSDVSSKSTHYLEPESREGASSFRGSSRPFRSPRGFRGRGFRGVSSRGSTFFRGSFRGSYRNSSSPRARGVPRR